MASRTPARSSSRAASRPRATAAIPQLPWSRVRPAPVVLVTGPEEFLASRATVGLREILTVEDPRLEVSDVDADTYAPGQLMTLASPSLFDEPRLIRVSRVEKCTDDFLLDTLQYLEQPAEGTYLVLRHAGGVRGKKLLDAIRAGVGEGIEILCSELKRDSEKYEFAAAEFSEARRRVSGGALRALVAAFADDLAGLAAACQQLLSDAGEEITEETVDRYYGGRVETTSFQVADAAIAGRHGEALVLLRHAVATGTDPVPIVAAFASKIRTMAKVHGRPGSSGQLASRLSMAPWQIERAQSDLRGWDDEGLGRCIEMLAETDAAVKGESRDPVYAVERLVALVSDRGVRSAP